MVRFLVFTAIFSATTTAFGQGLSAVEIEAAIAAGLKGSKAPVSDCYATAHFLDTQGFSVEVVGPVGRVMRLAADAKKKYTTISPDSLPDGVAAATLSIVAVPAEPKISSGRWQQTPPAEHVVLIRKGAKGDNAADVLQPLTVEPVPAEWSNALGGKWQGQGIRASFDLAAFKAMPGEDIDIAIATTGDLERRCKIGKKDRAALR